MSHDYPIPKEIGTPLRASPGVSNGEVKEGRNVREGYRNDTDLVNKDAL